MAQRVEIQFVDDIDGSPAAETIRFGMSGVEYEIDLSAEHAKEFRESMQPFVAGARRVTGARSARGSRGAGPSPAAVRQWAKSAGIQVSDRGRVPDDLIARFQAAN